LGISTERECKDMGRTGKYAISLKTTSKTSFPTLPHSISLYPLVRASFLFSPHHLLLLLLLLPRSCLFSCQHYSVFSSAVITNVALTHLFASVSSQPRARCSRSDALVACSALKRLYRHILLYGSKALDSSSGPDRDVRPPTRPDVCFLFLHGDYDLIQQRMAARRGHYMKADLLRSQFDALEPPSEDENALPLDVSRSMTDMATEVLEHSVLPDLPYLANVVE